MSSAIKLTPEQEAVLAHAGGDLLVYAVAGAGKTTIILVKIRDLIQKGVPPEAILMTTFSKRGTEDMKRRAAELSVPVGVAYKTLHSVARSILWAAPTSRDPQLPPKWALVKVIKEELAKFAKNGYEGLPKVSEVFGEIGLAKAALVWPTIPGDRDRPADGAWREQNEDGSEGALRPDYLTWATTRERAPLDNDRAVIFEKCYAALELVTRAPEAGLLTVKGEQFNFKKLAVSREGGKKGKTKVRWVSFDDMLALTARCVLQRKPWVAPFRGTYTWVFIDEVQDNNEPQWVIGKFLRRACGSLVCVGDDMQSIFAFRGAQPAQMRTFAASGAKVQPLSWNFRCGSKILDAANGLLEHAPDRLYTGKLVCGRGPTAIGAASATAYGTPEEEAQGVVGEIDAAINAERANPDQIAVLYRLNAQSGPLEMECVKRRIAYKIAGSSFFKRGEIKAAIGYLGVALNEDDPRSFEGCFNVPLRKLGDAFRTNWPSLTSARKALANGELGRGFWREGVIEIAEIVATIKAKLADPSEGVAGALGYVFEDVGVRKEFRDDSADEESETEVDEACAALISAAAGVQSAVELVAYASDMSRVGHEDVGEHEGQRTATPRITLSTVHKAKGLEWDRVFVVGMTEGLFPFMHGDIEEERRLAYVALTRPREVLRVSFSSLNAHGQESGPGQFLHEARLLRTVEEGAETV